MSDKYKILFVCLGNICRSPAAEGIFRQMVEKRGLGEKLEADSAGTYAGHTGEQPDSRMRNAAYARGYLLTHRARQVRLRDFEEFDRIVVWGSYAQKKGAIADPQRNLILKAVHPSPLSVYRGFFGCRHFSRANDYLRSIGKEPIVW